MNPKTIVISINASWNIVNFRLGLIRGLKAAGHEIIVVAPADRHSAELARQGLAYVPIAIDKKGLSPIRDLQLLWRYWRVLKRLRPQAFLGYTAKPNIYGSLAAQALGIRVINNVSGLGTAFIRGGLLSHLVSFLYRLSFRRSSTIFFQNEEDRALFVRRGLVPAGKARLLPGSGIDLQQFAAAPLAPAGHGLTFLLVGRLLWDKGVGEYVAAAREVRAMRPETRFQLLGFLDSENRTAVSRADVDGWIAEGVIDYLGDTDDVRPFIAAGDCIVLPSYREGLPRTLLEAAAMARPVITTDVPGCRHIVEDGVNGYLCEVRSAPALAAAMLRMVDASIEEREAMARAGRRRVERDFDEQKVVAGYLAAIEDAFA